MTWQDIKLLLFMLLLFAILFLILLLTREPGSSPNKDDCVKPVTIGGALVIGEKNCDEDAKPNGK